MNSSKSFRNLINFGYYFMIVIWMIILGLLIFSIFLDSNRIMAFFNSSTEISIKSKSALISVISYTLISGAFWLYILRLFRNLLDSLLDEPLFDQFQSTSFKLIGRQIILLTNIDLLALFIFRLIFEKRLELEFDMIEYWLVIALGLFMVFLSKVFNEAKILKEENELTV
ncbi:Protein of unknown function [Christiangramia echinicola]|uniref:DUF2975 domain-containing protein n=2 Tax=Christiangramia echinicola TaxID=279359 RepID=A0A1H1MBN5_9FLAO|nr:Protein of unknown function [Christiangramia echinicola]